MFRPLVLAFAAVLTMPAAHSQVMRNFPGSALRGEMVITAPPEIRLNGRSARLSPGARLRDTNNLLVLSATLVDARLAVHYTLDGAGEVSEAWILRPDELANRPWPKTAREAEAWLFDPLTQTWTRP